MKMIRSTTILGLLLLCFFCSYKEEKIEQVNVTSPDGSIAVNISLQEGTLYYEAAYKNNAVIRPSQLGLALKRLKNYTNALTISHVTESTKDETWEQVWGQNKLVRNNYNESIISLTDSVGNHRFDLIFKVFNDGIGFRYSLPKQPGQDSIFIMDELTQFNLAEDLRAWYIPANFESYEMLYKSDSLSKVKSANTPITLEKEGLVVSIHEANLTNYAGMTLKKSDTDSLSFQSELVPWPDGVKVRTTLPMVSPWRTIQIVPAAEKLAESQLILNLNEPNALTDVSWIKPIKYIGVWWGMHLGTHTWTMGERHGATTEALKKYIDFAAEHNIHGVLAEGWNTGWEHWGRPKAFDFVTPYADFDLKMLADYANEKGVDFIQHHETGGDAPYYEQQMDTAFQLCRSLGMNHLKTGYAGPIQPSGQLHHGQFMVNHYRKVVETAAKYHLVIDAHEPIKPTGIRRTYPNMMTREGVRGMEWNGWSAGNPPEHHVILPFTRNLGGPIDYTPGIFDILYKNAGKRVKWNGQDKGNSRTNTTLAKQLALFVVFHSPMQMASDIIDNYEGHEAFQFIEDVPVDWRSTKVVNAKIGDYVTIARKDIQSEDWYMGSITDEEARNFEINPDFLDKEKTYLAEIYADSEKSHWETAPYEYQISNKKVNAEDVMTINLAAGGGQAIRFKAIDN